MAKLKPFKDLVKMNKFYYYKISINSLNKLILFNVFILITACQTKTRDTISLKNTFQNKFYIGAAINTAQYLEEDQRALPILNKHFNSITPENDLKWSSQEVHIFLLHANIDSCKFDYLLNKLPISRGEFTIHHPMTSGLLCNFDKYTLSFV